jgi:hypothetical protein
MHLTLLEVVSAMNGKTGMEILHAILAGERDPQRLASHRDRRCTHDQATIAKALEGHWRAEHLLSLSRFKLARSPTPRDTEASNAYVIMHDSLGPVYMCSLIGINSTMDAPRWRGAQRTGRAGLRRLHAQGDLRRGVVNLAGLEA